MMILFIDSLTSDSAFIVNKRNLKILSIFQTESLCENANISIFYFDAQKVDHFHQKFMEILKDLQMYLLKRLFVRLYGL